MIEILPMSDRLEEEKILAPFAEKTEQARVLEMTEQEKILGWVAVDLEKSTLKMLKFCVNAESDLEKSFYLDYLMRSAASYGEVKGADELQVTDVEQLAFFQKKGFEIVGDAACAPMSLIVHYI